MEEDEIQKTRSAMRSNTGRCVFFEVGQESVKAAAIVNVEQTICTVPSPSEIKVQISPLVQADLWQIFAGLASIAIALKTLFERRARVCLKSNQ